MTYQNILLIDDDEDDQEIFATALEQISGKVSCLAITSAREALHRLKQKEISPDVIFLDLNMPLMNGEQFLAAIKMDKLLRTIPVIIFSTTSHPETIVALKENGANDFITKPHSFDDLVSILRATVE